MRKRATFPLGAAAAAVALLAAGDLLRPEPAVAQESATLRLTVSPGLTQQMKEAPGEVAWTELPGHLTAEFASSGALGLKRVPVRLVAFAIREGEVIGEARTTPTLVGVGSSVPGTELAGADWPPVGDWFPAPDWRPDGIAPADPVTPETGAAASDVEVPSDAGAVVLYAAPAAAALRKRFVTVPVVVTTRPAKPPAADSAAPDSTGG